MKSVTIKCAPGHDVTFEVGDMVTYENALYEITILYPNNLADIVASVRGPRDGGAIKTVKLTRLRFSNGRDIDNASLECVFARERLNKKLKELKILKRLSVSVTKRRAALMKMGLCESAIHAQLNMEFPNHASIQRSS